MSAIRQENADVVKVGAFRLTLGTQVAAAIVALVTGLDPIFGDTFRPGLKTAIIIAAVAAFALIAVADILARSWATCCTQPKLALAPQGISVSHITKPSDQEAGWTAVAMRPKPDDPASAEFLVAKSGQSPEWVEAKNLKFS